MIDENKVVIWTLLTSLAIEFMRLMFALGIFEFDGFLYSVLKAFI